MNRLQALTPLSSTIINPLTIKSALKSTDDMTAKPSAKAKLLVHL